MALPTQTLPHNYIAIIKIFAMSLCTVSFTAFYLFSLDKPHTLMSLQRKHFRGTVSGGLQSNATEAEQCHGTGDWRLRPLMPLGDLHHPEALQFWVREGRARPAKVGPVVRIHFLVKEEAEKWIWDHLYIYIYETIYIDRVFSIVLSQKERRKKLV